jgi:glycerol-3-phosphate O-acyltransferase/dihydroxyacetone phosphate acyltransferase
MPVGQSALVGLVRLLVRGWFSRVEVTGIENIPADGGGVLVAWHPNGLIDPALILASFPKSVRFGARDTLFRVPLLGWLMRGLGTVPIKRPQEASGSAEARRQANEAAVDALATAVADGSFSCLFPEGTSHDASHLLELRPGAARLVLRAMERGTGKPMIVPVGLHYDDKRSFRSPVLVAFHPPVDPAAFTAPPDGLEPARGPVEALTGEIERVLHEVVRATENWDLHHLMHRARKLVRAERVRRAGSTVRAPNMAERVLGFARVWKGYYARLATHPEQVAALRARLEEYDADLRALGLDDHELDAATGWGSPVRALSLAAQMALVFLFLPQLLLVALVVDGPPALLLMAARRLFAKHDKDEATILVLGGAVLFPLVWVAAGVATWWLHAQLEAVLPILPELRGLAALLVVAASIVGGMAALRYQRLLGETLRAVRVRLTRSRRRVTLARLRVERSELHDAIVGLAEGLDLPGRVGGDGRVLAEVR